jgi:hypothetical protein
MLPNTTPYTGVSLLAYFHQVFVSVSETKLDYSVLILVFGVAAVSCSGSLEYTELQIPQFLI